MAKLKAKNDRFGRQRVVNVRVVVMAHGGAAGNFKACVVGLGTSKKTVRKTVACRIGQNPRRAVANALSEVAKQIRKRSGAFAGLKGK